MSELEELNKEITNRLNTLSDEERVAAQLETSKEEDVYIRASLYNAFGFPEYAKNDSDSVIRAIAAVALSEPVVNHVNEITEVTREVPARVSTFAEKLKDYILKVKPDPEQVNRFKRVLEVLNKVQKAK